ncbi:proteasome inhibitor PI31 subunit [Venturia canescens]|uniref:proteasome inhibitor PI31 subunit n=1 Tax=Venturia canescens TaxID=32260 RepID=UPI001C9C3A15|nr:proteasome inhibitor PI31 subunit [Venturia canescens]XP_043287844.1 proteasome inhibitor PI31 subunit [Venturia canescens]
MASEVNDYFGFELLNKIVEASLSKKEDVIILFTHWYFVKNGFKCIGLGDSKVFDPNTDKGTDFLPDQWNQQPNYSLRYAKDGKLYILVAMKSDANLLINLLRTADNGASSVEFGIEETVKELRGALEALIPEHRTVMNKIRQDLVEPLNSPAGREISTQTRGRTESPEERRRQPIDDDPLRVRPERVPREPWPAYDPRNVGRSDLDPFSRERGGMIFDPFAERRGPGGGVGPLGGFPPGGLGVPGRLPPGAVPPGARFDPFGPPDIGGGMRRPPRDPDADHLPPGFDDMFM